MTYPLPLNLASVAWLANEGIDEFVRYRVWDQRVQRRRDADLAIVVADQQRYIATLETMIRPGLVQPIAEQGSML